MTKVVVFLRGDRIGNCVYNIGDIAGFPDDVADRLCSREYAMRRGFDGPWAKLHGDGKVQKAGGRIPGAKDFWDNVQLEEHTANLKKEGWKPPPPVVVQDPALESARLNSMRTS